MKTLHRPDEAAIVPAQRAVALVELMQEADAADEADLGARVAAVLESFGETAVALTAGEVEELAAACGRLRVVLVTSDRDRAAEQLNTLLLTYAGPPRLVRHEGWDWHLHVDGGDDSSWTAWLLSSAALALASLLVSAPSVPWGRCASDGCDRLYVHDGRGGERRYCSARCATRERVRRHRGG